MYLHYILYEKFKLYFVALPVLLFFMNKIGARTLVFIGSLTISIGYGISSLAPNVDFLFFSISVVVGEFICTKRIKNIITEP